MADFSWRDLASLGLNYLGNEQATDAAGDAAAASLEAAKIAAAEAAFKPYGVTTGFGTGYFDPETREAGYTIDPALAAYRDQLMTMGAEGLPTSLATTPQEAGLQYYQDLQKYGGIAGDAASQYAGLGSTAASAIPTDISGTFAGLSPSAYSNMAQNQASLFGGAATDALGQQVADVSGAYAGLSPADYSRMSSDIASQYARAGSQALGQATPTASSLYEQIREMQRPEEERARSSLDRKLFGSGRAGMTTAEYGGTPEQFALAKAQEEARNAAAYQAVGQADQLATSQQGRAAQLSQMGLSADQIANALRTEQFGQQYQLGTAGITAAQAQQGLQSGAQQQALALAQQGLSADQIANQLAATRFGQQYELAQGGMTAAQNQANLANQLSQMGLNADQMRMAQAGTARTAGMGELDQAIARGTGLFSTGFGVEKLGMTPLEMGAAYGAKASSPSGADALLTGGLSAAQANLAGGMNTAGMFQQLGTNLLNRTA